MAGSSNKQWWEVTQCCEKTPNETFIRRTNLLMLTVKYQSVRYVVEAVKIYEAEVNVRNILAKFFQMKILKTINTF